MKSPPTILRTARAFPAWRQWLLRESFVHFMLLGALIFGLQAALDLRAGAGRRIAVTDADRAYLRAQFVSLWGREPDAGSMRQLVHNWLREEVMYRQALAEGMDRDDTIIRRRLVQKMDFLASADALPPTEAEVAAYYRSHLQAYGTEAGISFTQRYFRSSTQALQALAVLRQGGAAAGEAFMLPAGAERAPRSAIARDYGDTFAAALSAAPAGVWQGPLQSVHGWHLVKVGARQPAGAAPYETVRERVRTDLLDLRLEAAREASYQRWLRRYSVTGAEPAAVAAP